MFKIATFVSEKNSQSGPKVNTQQIQNGVLSVVDKNSAKSVTVYETFEFQEA